MLPQKAWTAHRREILAALIVILVFSIFFWSRRVQAVDLQFEADTMTIVGPSGAPFSVTLYYTDILAVSERNELDAGNFESGLNTEQCRFGTWRNIEFGGYTLCVSNTFSDYIILETTQGVVVFNYEDADATSHLYTALLELLESKGLEVRTDVG